MTNLPTTLPLSPAYRSQIRFTLLAQFFLTLFLLTILDGGVLAKTAGCAMVGFWLGVAVILLRRPLDPRAGDLFFIRWGFFLLLIAGMVIAQIVSIARG